MLRRTGLDTLLLRLLCHQKNVERYIGTVSRLLPSKEIRNRLDSVVVRRPDGVEETLKDVALVVGTWGIFFAYRHFSALMF